MKAIHDKVNVVPLIAKADTLTMKEVAVIKRRVRMKADEHAVGCKENN